jgi:hypothetical protein
MSSIRITYSQHSDVTPESERLALAAVYRFIIDCHAKNEATCPGSPDDANEAWFPPGGGVLSGGGTSVGTVVRTRGGDHVETNLVSTDQRAQEDQE